MEEEAQRENRGRIRRRLQGMLLSFIVSGSPLQYSGLSKECRLGCKTNIPIPALAKGRNQARVFDSPLLQPRKCLC